MCYMIIKSIDRLNIKQYFHYFSNVETETFQKIESRDEFRAWLAKNHAIENECYAIVKRGRPTNDDTFWYIDAVEEALCFGWIDSKVKSFGNGMLMQRFSPRRKSCNWSELNKERCRRMEKLGLTGLQEEYPGSRVSVYVLRYDETVQSLKEKVRSIPVIIQTERNTISFALQGPGLYDVVTVLQLPEESILQL